MTPENYPLLNLYDVVALMIPLQNLRQGQVGTVVEILDEKNQVFEIEFTDNEGKTITSSAVERKYLLKLEYELALV